MGGAGIIGLVNALERFEDWLHQVVEGRLTTLLGARVQPVDLAKRLAEHMEDHRTIGAGRVYVPNNYRVYLAPRTLAEFASFKTALEGELAGFLSDRATERGDHFVGRVTVKLLADPDLPRERVRIESDVIDSRGLDLDDGEQRTRPIPLSAKEAPTPVTPAVLTIGNRKVLLAGPGPMSIGRSLDNDVIVDDPSVSRHHARLVPRGHHWMLEDLNSTHGTFVNGHRVSASLLRPGDQVRLGSQVAYVEEPDDGKGSDRATADDSSQVAETAPTADSASAADSDGDGEA